MFDLRFVMAVFSLIFVLAVIVAGMVLLFSNISNRLRNRRELKMRRKNKKAQIDLTFGSNDILYTKGDKMNPLR